MDDHPDSQDIYKQTLERVCAYYQDLQDSALRIVAPRRDGLRAWLFSFITMDPPVTHNPLVRFSDWYYRNIFVLFASPLRSGPPPRGAKSGAGYVAIAGLLFYLLSLATCLLLLLFIFNRAPANQIQRSGLGFDALLFMLSVAAVLFLVPANYVRLYYLVANHPKTRYHPLLLWSYLGLFVILLAAPFWSAPGNWYGLLFSAPSAVWQSWLALVQAHFLFVFIVVFLFIIPGYTQVYVTVIELAAFLVWGAWLIIDALRFFHTPLPMSKIKELAFEPIPCTGGEWRLRDLTLADLEMLKEWAANNRESTDKRLIPSILLISVLQFVGWNTIFGFLEAQSVSGYVLGLIQNILSSNYITVLLAILQFVLLLLVIQLLIIPLRTLFALFKNLLTQSIILETCIVAEHAKKQSIAAQQAMPIREIPTPIRKKADVAEFIRSMFRHDL